LKRVSQNNPIVFFDGECGLCDRSVQFIIKHDLKGIFHFCPLQSSIAKEIIPEDFLNFNTVILYDNQVIYSKSSAAFRILRKLKTWYRILLIFTILPRFITDAIYILIARNRKRIFKSPPTCQLPSPDLQKRIL
jgi:predicted DCC family thiol-disulfide oxidoreductase YuxK